MDPQALINITAGLAIAVGGWFARQLWDGVQRLKEDIHKIEVDLPKTYVSKDDFSQTMQRIEDMLERIYDKLDGKVDKP
jgi:hypothetical protein